MQIYIFFWDKMNLVEKKTIFLLLNRSFSNKERVGQCFVQNEIDGEGMCFA